MHLAQTLTAWHTFAAGFFSEKINKIPCNINHAGIFIQNNHSAGTHHGAGLGQFIKPHLQIQLLFGNTSSGRTSCLHCLKFFTSWNAAADFIDNIMQGHAHGYLNKTGIINFPNKGKNLCPLACFCADFIKPVSAIINYKRYIRPCFNIIQNRRLLPQPFNIGTDIFRSGFTHPAFKGSH